MKPCFNVSFKCAAALAGVLMSSAFVDSAKAGGWYVSNTASTEMVRYKRVFLSAGTYRFTARAGSPVSGSTFHLEVNNTTVQSGVAVPNTGRADAFANVHLGRVALTQGYYDLKIVFDSANISLDWFMLSKDTDATTSVKASDVTMQRPDTSGMLIAPITAFSAKMTTTGLASALTGQPANDANGQPFSDAQLKSWYAIPMYKDYDRRGDRFWDILVDDLLASRAQVPLLHCRETKDLTRGLQDRDYAEGPGAFEGRWLLKLSEAVARNPQAASALKIGMFWENGGIADIFEQRYGYFPAWGDPALVDYVMDYWLAPWFDSVPASMLYMPSPSRPIISVFSGNPESMVKDGKMGDFLVAVRSRMQEKYGYNPLFILPTGGDVDGNALAAGWGQAPWVTWDGPLLEKNSFAGNVWGTTMVGSRRRIDTVWLNDWNPATNTGTPNPNDANGHDSFQSRLDANGDSQLLTSLTQAKNLGVKLVQQEGFTNIAEGNSINRSYHAGWTFPNQHLAAMREFADPTTPTLIFEAEGCDDYTKVVSDGNSGESYRESWYTQNDLDVYRPLHNLQGWISKNTGPANLVQVSAGFYDAWAVASDGKVWAQPIMGAPNTWTRVTSAPTLTAISVGKEYVWGLNGTAVYSTKIPYGWSYWASTGWTLRTGTMTSISTGTTEVWATNASGQVFRRPADGTGDWTMVTGTMDKVFAGDGFVWGMQGGNIYYTRTSSISWTLVSNPNSLTTLAVGSEEVWGVNAAGQVYRRSISGIGGWDSISAPAGTLTNLSIGDGYAWGMVGGTPVTRRLEGFQGSTALPPFAPRAIAGIGQVTLNWTATTGATGYNVKRSTTAGGPYTTIAANVAPSTTLLSYSDATVSSGTTYYYVVSALSPVGETGNSSEISGIPQSAVPAAPINLAASLNQGNQVTLTWSDAATTETGFKIERKKGSGAYLPVMVVGKNVTTFSESIPMGADYFYRVCAYNAAGYSAYSNEAVFSTSGNRLARTGWTATASVSTGGSASNALDGNIATRWATGGPQTAGQWFQLDMGSLNTIYQIDLEVTGGDYPRGYEVLVSADGINWTGPVATGPGTSGITAITFSPQKTRYVKITQTGTAVNWWSISEINAYGQPAQDLSRTGWVFSASVSGPTSPPANAGDGNIATRWANGAAQANGQWFMADMGAANLVGEITLDAGASTGDYPRGYQVHVSNDGVNWGNPIASGAGSSAVTTINFTPRTVRYLRVTQTGTTTGTFWSIHEFRAAGAPMQTLSRTGWTASASASGGSAPPSNSIDGNAATRWGNGGAQVNGQWFQMDLGGVRAFRQIVMDSANSNNDFPRGYQVFVSLDGTTWGNAVAIGSGSSAITTITFQQQVARYIRVVQTGSTTGTWWSIHEFNVYDTPIAAPAIPVGFVATGGDGEMSLNWAAVSGATTYTIKRSLTTGGPYTVLASDVIGTAFVDATVTNGTPYYYVISAVNNSGVSANSAQSAGTAGALPSPWLTQNIGSVGIVGNANYVSPTYTLAGSGSDIWGTADAFRYVYQPASGDCSIVAKILSQQNTHGSAKSGVMLRESSVAGSIHASVMVSPGAVNFQWRSTTGGPTSSASGGGVTLPVWLKLTRTGNSISAFRSPDGATWTQIGTAQTVTMAGSAIFGMAASSHDNTKTSTATFDNVTAAP